MLAVRAPFSDATLIAVPIGEDDERLAGTTTNPADLGVHEASAAWRECTTSAEMVACSRRIVLARS